MKDAKICTECGTENTSGNKFCEGCGANITKIEVQKVKEKKPVESSRERRIRMLSATTVGTREYEEAQRARKAGAAKRMYVMTGVFGVLGVGSLLYSTMAYGDYEDKYEDYKNAGYGTVEEVRVEAESAHTLHTITWAIGITYTGIAGITYLIGNALKKKYGHLNEEGEDDSSGLIFDYDRSSEKMEVAYVVRW